MGTYILFSLILFTIGSLVGIRKKKISVPYIVVSLIAALAIFGINTLKIPMISWHTPAGYLEAVLFFGIMYSFAFIENDNAKDNLPTLISFVISGVVMVGIWASGWSIFRANKQQKILQVTEMADTMLHISPVPLEKMCIINATVARNLVAQKLGELQNKYVLGEFRKQSLTGSFKITEFNGNETEVHFDNQIVFVAPLEHGGFFKWFRNRYTEGYALVNASDPSEYYLVKAVNGQELKLKYLESGYFGNFIRRHVRMKYPHLIADDYGIELDNHGMPFNTVTILENKFGFGTKVVKGSLIVDVQTGEIKEYSLEETPDWVNLVCPQDVTQKQIYYWGEYIHGWWNPSQKDRKEASPGMDIVYNSDGCSYYVGIQAKKTESSSSSTSTIGYMMIDTRTGQATFYAREGINEVTAKAAMLAEPSIANAVKLGTVFLDDAVFYMVDGLHTYFATFISPIDNMPKFFGFCNAETKEIVGIGATLQEAKAAYLKSAAQYKQRTSLKSGNSSDTIKKTVTVSEKVQEGNCYYFRFKETGKRVFYAYGELLPEVRWRADKVIIGYRNTEDALTPLTSYSPVE